MKDFTWIKMSAAMVCGMISSLLGGADTLLYTLLVCMAADYLTGVIAAFCNGSANSKTGFRGILKKAVVLFIVAAAHAVGQSMHIGEIREMVVGFYIANEAISVLENAGRMDIPVCRRLTVFLEQMREDADEKEHTEEK